MIQGICKGERSHAGAHSRFFAKRILKEQLAWAFAGVPGSWLAVTLDASTAQETSVGGDGRRAWKEVGGTVAESSCGEH